MKSGRDIGNCLPAAGKGKSAAFSRYRQDMETLVTPTELGRLFEPGTLQPDALRLLLDSVTDHAVFLVNRDGTVATWHGGAEAVTGYSAAEMIGQNFSRLFTDGDNAQGLPAKTMTEALRSGRSEHEGWRLRKDGSRYWATTTLTLVRGAQGAAQGFACVSRDITDRMAAQDALHESERRFRLLVEGVTDYAIFMLDPYGIVTNWNAGAERLKGYRADEIIGQHFSRFYGKEDRAHGLPARFLETAAREGRFEAEGWRYRKDGTRFWASVVIDAIRSEDGRLIGFAKVTRDVSERRVAQEALRESERQFRLLLDSVHDYALFMLDPNGVVVTWNAGAERIKGYSAEEVVGTHFSRFYTEEDRAQGLPAHALRTALDEGRFEQEGKRVRRDGSVFWANVVIHPVRNEANELVGFAKITRDITERRQAQLALQQIQAQRNQAQKMEALGHLTGGVAHDFNNLLMIISGQSQVLKRHVGENPKVARACEAVESAIARGASLTRQLLTFSRRQTLNPKPIELKAQIASFKSMLSGTMANLRIVADLKDDIWPVKVDPNELELALLNLAINARDAMEGSGTITISAENVRLSGHETPAKIAGDFVAVCVADNGAGIPADILPNIFDPFFTTKHSSRGSGLGLSQVHGFTHQSGGTVTVESRLGQGARFTVYLPRGQGSEENAAIEDAAQAGSEKILVVEDNPQVADATSDMLEELGYRKCVVGGAEDAKGAIAREKFDLVFADVIMPGSMDGLDLAREIRAENPEQAVLLTTGYSERIHSGLEFPILRKPYNLTELSRAVRSAIAASKAKPDNLIRIRREPF
jgi:PAS domain S-box-containing protein